MSIVIKARLFILQQKKLARQNKRRSNIYLKRVAQGSHSAFEGSVWAIVDLNGLSSDF